MAETTGILWTDSTFNPWRGCTKVSPGCTHCYAETLSHRNPAVLGEWGPEGNRPVAAESYWQQPLRWNFQAALERQRHRVFCASLCDVFEDVPDHMTAIIAGARERLWELIGNTPWLDWQLLTKRPENINRMLPAGCWPNIWLGTSVESQEWDWRLDALREARHVVPVRFCSAEPLLGPLRLLHHQLAADRINWVIVGGESGSQARQCNISWCRDLVSQCRSAQVACFVKQLGDLPVHDLPAYSEEMAFAEACLHRRLGRKGADMARWPAWLRIQQFPMDRHGNMNRLPAAAV